MNALGGARELRAGPLAVRFEGGDLRRIRLGEREVVRRIYGAVRDRNWGTVAGRMEGLEVEAAAEGFRIRYTSTHQEGEIDFVWQAEFEGTAEGVIRCRFEGLARSDFWRNRIGFCVLHPLRECAGARVRARYADGRMGEARFPEWVAAEQPIAGLDELAGLAHEVEPGVWAELEFRGEIFEMEDQRNWIDASFKTFGTPLRLPFPVRVAAGTRIEQEVVLRMTGLGRKEEWDRWRVAVTGEPRVVKIEATGDEVALPAMGLGCGTLGALGEPLSARAVGLGHLRVEAPDEAGREEMQGMAGFAEADALGLPVELVIDLDRVSGKAGARKFLEGLARGIEARGIRLARVLVFGMGERHATSEAGWRLAKEHLGRFGAPIGGGSNADLYELNLYGTPAGVECVAWSMNPQVHAFDDMSLAETPEAVPQQIESTRRRYPGKALCVSPVTLKPRFNAVATEAGSTQGAGLPGNVDARQMSLLGAAWTLGVLKGLAEGGAASGTFFETVGWRGVMEREGGVFPLYHVLADFGEFAGGTARVTRTSDPGAVTTLWLRRGEAERLMVANLTRERREVGLQEFDRIVLARVLEESGRLDAMTAPEDFRASAMPWKGGRLALGPYAVATLDMAPR